MVTSARGGVTTTNTYTIGAGANTSGTSDGDPVNIYCRSRHFQFIYTSNDLATAGFSGTGRVTKIGFYIAGQANYAMPSYLVRMKHTTASTLSAFEPEAGLTLCASNATCQPPAGGFDMITLTSPFDFNGTNNILLDTAFAQTLPTWHASGLSKYDVVAGRSWHVSYDSVDCRYLFSEGGANLNRLPQLRLEIVATTPVTATVSPSSGPFAGGNRVVVTNATANIGSGTDITNVVVGGVGTTNITGQGTNWVAFIAPATGSAGVKDIVIQTSDNGDITLTGAYTYNPAGEIGHEGAGGWTNLSSGFDNTVNALALDTNGDLYAGGDFATAGSVAATNIAKWNGTTWTNLGAGMDNFVYALALDTNGNLYAGGRFETAGGVAANGIAKWNGTTWTNLGDGMNNYVNALALDTNGNLYAGGAFANAGGVAANRIAKWNGTTWTNLGSGMNGDAAILALALDPNGNLYAGGTFTNAGGVAANGIAKWNGTTWTNLSDGMNGNAAILALALDPNGTLYAGGLFTNAGGVAASRIAKWSDETPASFGVSPVSCPVAGGVTVTISGTNLCNGTTQDVTSVTLCGATATVQSVAGSTQIVVVAGIGDPGLGHVVVNSIEYGETVKSNAFTYNPVITAGAGPHGTVAPSGVVDVVYGGSTSFVATADAYYHIGSLTTNSVSVGEATNRPAYTSVWENVTATGTLVAAFAANLTTNTGTPEMWLAQYGWTNNFDVAATNDADGDRMPTWAEYLAGTVPTNTESALRIEQVGISSGTGMVVRWQSVDGKWYRLERGTNLLQVPAFNYLLRTNILGIAPLNTETDATTVGQGPWFYRIKVEP